MSQLPPTLATPRHGTPARTDFVRPIALTTLLVCVAMIVWFLLQALVAWPIGASQPWQMLVALAEESEWPASLRWMLAHPVATSLLLAAVCVPSLVSSWGLYKGTRWGLLSFVWLLVITGIANIGVAWWMDRVAAVLIDKLGEADVVEALNAQRILFTATVLGSCVLFAVLQGWLAWRLMRPDIRSRY
ncbi:hypothetical protein [Stenotrophomonas sp. SORGH_AS_0321]|uniref:hypothetical protein n=1 Tax=Stenotrophomonas sp. SORGH_AS_0321 TaxID=3041787 RepID=UPI002854BC11|nr:hypothetical protein [Stenotrophomonas sp. SORGH_AS_0321]MDR6092822.1 hypothetical protein [Stenotrophomonas sp. SORGH_AS_0321]